MAQLVEHYLREVGAACSNHVTPTYAQRETCAQNKADSCLSLLKNSCPLCFVHTANAATTRDAKHSESVGKSHITCCTNVVAIVTQIHRKKLYETAAKWYTYSSFGIGKQVGVFARGLTGHGRHESGSTFWCKCVF